jgi:hypothetical protein
VPYFFLHATLLQVDAKPVQGLHVLSISLVLVYPGKLFKKTVKPLKSGQLTMLSDNLFNLQGSIINCL